MNKLKYYLPLIFIFLTASVRVYFNCFRSVQESCLDKQSSLFSDETKFPGKQLSQFRIKSIDVTRKYLPSPHSELLIGMVIGADELGKIPYFKEALKTTGTIHVVVVSGFNVSLVASMIMSVLGSKYKIRNLLIAQFFTFTYSVMTGFEPPVIRAWIMGSTVSWVKYYGRSVDGFIALLFTALIMIVIWPYFLLSVSFQLSFLATLGLIVFGNSIVEFFTNLFRKETFFIEDLGTTISAQVFVLPIVSYYFGRVSIISFLVNPLVLWTVPIATVLGTFFIFIAGISSFLAKVMSIVMYPFLNIFVVAINFFSQFSFSSVNFTVGIVPVLFYYFSVLLIIFLIKRKMKKETNEKK
jgi:competence protein ComEC